MYVQPDHVDSLVAITGRQHFECIDALSNSVTFEKAVMLLLNVDEQEVNKIRVGNIVVSVTNNDYFVEGEPTKVVAKFNKDDRAWLEIGGKIQDRIRFYMDYLILEDLNPARRTTLSFTYLNKKIVYLPKYAFKLANERDKLRYHKLSKDYKHYYNY